MESYFEDDSPLAALLEGQQTRLPCLKDKVLTRAFRQWHRRRLVQLPRPRFFTFDRLRTLGRALETLDQALHTTPKPSTP